MSCLLHTLHNSSSVRRYDAKLKDLKAHVIQYIVISKAMIWTMVGLCDLNKQY